MKVHEYVRPEVFEEWRLRALEMGFLHVASGPLVRSSYKAGEAFIENVIRKRKGEALGQVGVRKDFVVDETMRRQEEERAEGN